MLILIILVFIKIHRICFYASFAISKHFAIENSWSLLPDEPTSSIGYCPSDGLALIQRLSHQCGLTVIAVLHDINMAVHFCDHLVVLRDGKVVVQGTSEMIMQADVLRELYDLPMGIFSHSREASTR